MRIFALLVALFVALIHAAEPIIFRGLASAELKYNGQTLDIYPLAEKENLVVVV